MRNRLSCFAACSQPAHIMARDKMRHSSLLSQCDNRSAMAQCDNRTLAELVRLAAGRVQHIERARRRRSTQ